MIALAHVFQVPAAMHGKPCQIFCLTPVASTSDYAVALVQSRIYFQISLSWPLKVFSSSTSTEISTEHLNNPKKTVGGAGAKKKSRRLSSTLGPWPAPLVASLGSALSTRGRTVSLNPIHGSPLPPPLPRLRSPLPSLRTHSGHPPTRLTPNPTTTQGRHCRCDFLASVQIRFHCEEAAGSSPRSVPRVGRDPECKSESRASPSLMRDFDFGDLVG